MASRHMLEVLQKLFRAHPEGLTVDEIVERYRLTVRLGQIDKSTGRLIESTVEQSVAPRNRRPKHIRLYLQSAIDLGAMREESSPQGVRYYAFESFLSLVEVPAPLGKKRELIFAYDPENPASREVQAKACKEELEARFRAERKAEERRQQEEFRRRWEAGAEQRAQEEAKRIANSVRIVDGRVHCPRCNRVFAVETVASWKTDQEWAICKPDGCNRSFDLPKRLAVCSCGRCQSVPEGKKHGICECGAFVRSQEPPDAGPNARKPPRIR